MDSKLDLRDAALALRRRGGLPGAHGYDLAAAGFRHAISRGAEPLRLLPAAMPASWMVNNRAPSTVFKKWLEAPLVGRWDALLDRLAGGYDVWSDADAANRAAVGEDVAALCIDGHGVAAVSKVLALLVPETVPLMDDSAVHFMTGGVPKPVDDKAPTAGAAHFVPMLDAFTAEVRAHEEALIALARDYALAPLDTAQVLDRVLWYQSFGHTHFSG